MGDGSDDESTFLLRFPDNLLGLVDYPARKSVGRMKLVAVEASQRGDSICYGSHPDLFGVLVFLLCPGLVLLRLHTSRLVAKGTRLDII
jgi:hypothetical protein